jgi:tetratricopeptide (TPR) repeat protein
VRLILLALLACSAFARSETALLDAGFDHFYNLEYDQAIGVFRRAIAANPNSPDLHNYLAESIQFREMFRIGALESEMVSGNNAFLRRPKMNPTAEVEKAFLGEVNAAMSLANAQLQKSPNDARAMYALGIAYGLRCNWFWLVRKAWRDSLRDATSARRLHNRVSELEPGNVDARLVQGLHDYLVGSLPFHYRMLGFLVGIHGDKDRGIRTLQDVARNGKLNKVDAEIFLGALYRRENQPASAVPVVRDLIRRYPRNFLLRLELSQMLSMAGDGKAALDVVEEISQLKRRHAPGFDRVSWETICFQAGTIQFWYSDLDRSLENMKKVTAAAEEVDLNTGVQAWLRIGQIYDLTNHRQQALEAYRRAISFAPQADAAQESKKYLSSPYRRDPA